MFARIHGLLYQKRRAGKDVIDLGRGNPSDPPRDIVVQKLVEAAADPDSHGYGKWEVEDGEGGEAAGSARAVKAFCVWPWSRNENRLRQAVRQTSRCLERA